MARFAIIRRLKPAIRLCPAKIAAALAAAAGALPAAAEPAAKPPLVLAAPAPAGGNPLPLGPGSGPFGGAPFPAADAAASGQKNAFSYALEGGFIRISFAQIGADAAGGGADSRPAYGLIELDLKPGWKTYWRNPGTSGFAPQIHLDGGAQAQLLYPAPQIFDPGEDWTYGYKHHVALPFRLILPQPRRAVYTGSLTLGICSRLCLPQTLPFRFSAADSAAAEKAALRAAIAALPQPAGRNFGLLSAKKVKGGLALQLAYPRGADTPQLFLDGGSIQLGPAAARETANNKTGKGSKTAAQSFYAPLLFGELKSGTPIYYTAVSGNKSVSGVIHIQP